MWAVIGGSGFEAFEGVEVLEELPRETPFGLPSSGFRKIKVAGRECLFLSRHGAHHELVPGEINYRANIFALKAAGASKLVSFSSVGNLQPGIEPSDLILPTQYLNLSKRKEGTSFAGEGVVGHVALGHPTWEKGSEHVALMAAKLSIPCHQKRTYVCIEGPTFSTAAESKMYQKLGGDVIGMTGFPEYALAREAGLSFIPCCFSTDCDSWNDQAEHVTLEKILPVMAKNKASAFALLKAILQSPLEADPEITASNLRANLFCSWEHLTAAQQRWLAILG